MNLCEREKEGEYASVCDKMGKRMCVLLNVQFQLALEKLSHSHTFISRVTYHFIILIHSCQSVCMLH